MIFLAFTSTVTVKLPVWRQCQDSGGFCGDHFSWEESKASATLFCACQNRDTVMKWSVAWTESTTHTLSSYTISLCTRSIFGSSSQFSCKWHQANWPKQNDKEHAEALLAVTVSVLTDKEDTLQQLFQIISLHTELMNVVHREPLQYLQSTTCASSRKKEKKPEQPHRSGYFPNSTD